MRGTHSLISPASAPISGPYIDTRRAHSRSRSPPPKRHRSENRGKRRDSPQQARAEKVTNDSNADTRYSTTTTRPNYLLCYRCGKKHGHVCKLSIHHDVNTNHDVK